MRRIGFVLVAAIAVVAGATGSVSTTRAAAVHAPAMPFDFNGDGYADLAVGVPGEALAGTGRAAGSVNVLYGSSAGVTEAGDQAWSQDSPGVKGRGEGGDGFGSSLASGDLNGDGYADLAIAAHEEKLGRFGHAGAVNVLYGSSHGLTAAGDTRLAAPAIALVENRALGYTMAAGDVNGDGYDDLAIGAAPGLGVMEVVFGSATGLHETDARVIDRTGPLAIGDVDGDGFEDLAIGQPDDDSTGVGDAGAVEVRYGSSMGPSTTRIEVWTQDSPGIDDEAESSGEGETYQGEYFGQAIAIGDVNGDGKGDLIAATPGEIGDGQGAINVIFGSSGGLTGVGSQFLAAGVAGFTGTASGFGYHLAVGDLDGDGADDLAIAGVVIPDHFIGDGGTGVLTLAGGASGLSADSARLWSQGTPGVPGREEPGDNFGRSGLASADYNGSGRADLAIGVGWEDFAGLRDAGAVVVLYGTSTGLGTAHAQIWTQNSPGVRGRRERRDEFGSL